MSHREAVLHYFDFLETKGLALKRAMGTVGHWTPIQIGDFLVEHEQAFPYLNRVEWVPTDFDLVASESLAGGIWPCSSTECRIRRVDELSRFVALYGEKVITPSPIPFGIPDHIDDLQRMRILDNLLIMNYYRPLLEAGILGITPRYYSFCAHHFKEFKKLERRLSKIAKTIVEPHLNSIEVTFKRTSRRYTKIGFKGPEKFFEHSETWIAQRVPLSELKRHGKKAHVLAYLDHILEDILNQQLINAPGYISDRDIDYELIDSLSNDHVKRASRAIHDGLSHYLPFVQQVPLSVLLKLRQSEGESFRVYRDSLTKAIKSIDTSDPSRIKEVFNDQVRPELNRIDLLIKNSRQLLTGSIMSDLVISAGFLGIGLFSGWIPPAISSALAAVGGYKFVTSTAREIRKALRGPDKIKDEKFYFLWKVKQSANAS